MDADLFDYLRSHGFTEAEIEEAKADGSIVRLTLECKVLGSNPGVFTVEEIVERSGIDRPTTEALWRSLGFPVLDNEDAGYGELDLAALESAKLFFELPEELPLLLHQTRVMSASLSRVAETMSDRLIEGIRLAESAAASPIDVARISHENLDVDALLGVIDHLFRRQLMAVLERRLDSSVGADNAVPTVVGFADLAGFTRLSQRLSAEELTALVDLFESETIDTVAQHGGRVVKTIGDEVMFVAESPATAVDLGLRLTEIARENELLPDLRIGIAAGDLVLRRGDYFGDAVNRASRLTNFARPGTVLTSNEVRTAIDDDSFAWRSLGRVRLKDLGPTRVFVARRPAGS